ncbi:MAG: GTPase domain-containing protein [Rubrivivax sp.]|nr:GTPase domain-containing protein [Rubrivivax sp.]
MTTITLSLVSHTNVGKTTLARTLLGRDIGEVRDAPHVTEFADEHLLVQTVNGHRLVLWDTPGFGDSVRLARRMRQFGGFEPLRWLLGQVWDRWRDRALWLSQQALRHVREGSDVLLYLVNASEPDAGYLPSEMQLLGWAGQPVLVLLNQLGAPRQTALEQAEVERWRERLAPWTHVRAVLPLDAFARCWVHERVLLDAVRDVLAADNGNGVDSGDSTGRLAAMDELRAAWLAEREATFERSCAEIAASLARTALAREEVGEAATLSGRLREWGARLVQPEGTDPGDAAQQRLLQTLAEEVRQSTRKLLELHGIGRGAAPPATRPQGHPAGAGDAADPVARVLARVANQVESHRRVPEGRAALFGGALTGALAGLKADIATGGLTLGGGLIAGGILGALGAAGLARGINVVRGTGRSWVAWSSAAMGPLVDAALLRYLAVAHYGRGRGEWAEGEAPAHWPATVEAALAARRSEFERLWNERSEAGPGSEQRLAEAVQPLVAAALRDVLAALYPASPPPAAVSQGVSPAPQNPRP